MKIVKNPFIIYSCVLFLVFSVLFATPIRSQATENTGVTWPEGPNVAAEGAVVMELSTGAVIYEKNGTQALEPASITKVMTALLALENSSLTDIVPFSQQAVYGNGANSSSIGMTVGESLTMEECLYGMMLASANEVAKAIAEKVGGTIEQFVTMMNERAVSLGCKNTNFNNPNGLHDEKHYTCAYDMALIAREAIKNPVFRKIIDTRTHIIPATDEMEERPVANTHQMYTGARLPEYYYEDCYGGKTGFTDEARYTLVTYAKRGDLNLVCVVMKSPMQKDMYEDTIKLLDYAFDNFSIHKMKELNATPSFDNFSLFTRYSPLFDRNNAPLSIDTTASIVLPNGASFSNLTQDITYHSLDTLVEGTNVIGEITYQYGDRVVGTTDILYESTEDVLLTSPTDTNLEETKEVQQEENTKAETLTSLPDKETNHSKKKGTINPFIIIGILLFLIVLYIIYYRIVELPRLRRRRSIMERQRRRRKLDKF